MENRLRKIFEYQRFANSGRLAEIIEDTEMKYGRAIEDEALETVAAAGDIDICSASEFVPI